MILSAAMMFEWLGTRHGNAEISVIGKRIESAVERMLKHSTIRTLDLGGSASTTEVARAVIDHLGP